MDIKDRFTGFIHDLQDEICLQIESIDGKSRFREDKWSRDGGGGGRTRVITDGAVFEKGGVNTSVVYGELPDVLRSDANKDAKSFYACGISLVLHPLNPMVPTTHANFRYFALRDEEENIIDQWFGGGADLTPYYLFREDAIHFHQTFKDACDQSDKAYYPKFKQWCDEYFYLPHRDERRGVGGIFFDHLRSDQDHNLDSLLTFVQYAGHAFIPAYLPLVERRKDLPCSQEQRHWQLIRRGRYVEFNLIYDRGTLFGLKTKGRIESILMSLPPLVKWEYDHQPEEGSEEDTLIKILKQPVNWLS